MIRRLLTLLLALSVPGATLLAQTDPCGTVTILNGGSISLCRGQEVELQQTNDLSNPTYAWSPAADFVDPVTDASPRVQPQASGYYRVTASGDDGCTVTDSIYIDVEFLAEPSVINDTTVCQGPLSLIAEPVEDSDDTEYELQFGDSIIVEATPANNFTFNAVSSGTYTLVSRSLNGACDSEQDIVITVTPAYLNIQQDTVFACLGSGPTVLSVQDTPFVAGTEITWSPVRFNSTPPSGRSYTVQPVADITYFASATINGCALTDSVAVRLDSLPDDLSLELDPEKDPYCQGDTFYVLSPVYDAGDFPIITHEWTEAPGLQSPRDLYNGVFVGQDTATLTRITRNGACVDTNRIEVNVVEPPVVTFTPDTVVCPGEPVQITATFETGEGTLEWQDPTNTLSCTDCLDPIATVEMTTEYTIELTTSDNECTTDLSYTLQVVPNVTPDLTTETLLCPGDSRQLIVGGVVPGYSYRITGGGIDSNDPNILVTPTENTTYTIETDGECGISTETIELVVLGDYTVAATGPDVVCAGQPLSLTASPSIPGLGGTYTWTLSDGSEQTGQTISVADPITGTYTVTFSDGLGCGSATDDVSIEVLGEDIDPVVLATLPDGTTVGSGGSVFAGNDVELTVTNLPADQTFTYSWTGTYTSGSVSGQSITVTVPRADGAPQPFVYTVVVTSENGQCSFEATFVLTVEQSRVEAPDLFTPNGDGRNDGFRLFYNGTITDYTMIVYDRWGQKVFTSDDPTEAWDGTKNESPQPSDVYLYLAKFRQDGVELQQEGQVTLVR